MQAPVVLNKRENFFVVRLAGDLQVEDLITFHKLIKEVIIFPKHLYIDGLLLAKMTKEWLLTLSVLGNLFQLNSFRYYLVNFEAGAWNGHQLSGAVLDSLQRQCNHNVLELFENSFERSKESQDFGVLQGLYLSTVKTFFIQFDLLCYREAVVMKKREKAKLAHPNNSFVQVNVDQITYLLGLSLSQSVFSQIIKELLGKSEEEIDGGDRDALAEILNIITGLGRSFIKSSDLGLGCEIPQVINGTTYPPYEIAGKGSVDYEKSIIFMILFNTPYGPFQMEVILPHFFSLEDFKKILNLNSGRASV